MVGFSFGDEGPGGDGHDASSTPPEAMAESLADAAYRVLHRRIVCLELRPGTRFSAVKVGRELGFGRMPVREALTRLEKEGLVQPVRRSGHVVAPVTLDSVRDVFHLRRLLEPEAAALAAERVRDPSVLEELDRLCRASYDASDPSTIGPFLEANTTFHVGIAAIGNPRLARILRDLLAEQERVFHVLLGLSYIDDLIAHEHKDLLNAIAVRDPDAARRVTREQLEAAQARTEEALISSKAVTGLNVGADSDGPT